MGDTWLTILVYLGTSGLVLGVFVWFNNVDARRAAARLRGLIAPGATPTERGVLEGLAASTLPKLGTPLLPTDEERHSGLQAKFVQAGILGREAIPIYLGVKMTLIALPAALAFLAGTTGLVSPLRAALAAAVGSTAGMVAPGLWLDGRRRRRQAQLRLALPDALDMIVLCVEGGVSLTSALQRVTAELQTAHPSLGLEMNVAQREMMLGLSPGEAFQKLGHRTGLDEARSLATVLLQAERYGAGLVKALRIHADTLRHQRQQKAEEMAQKAAVKILFPTLLCIFPAIFIVILGPAAFKIAEIFSKMN
jgi:tight adherence protein C